MTEIQFGPIDTLLLFGGGRVLRHVARTHRDSFTVRVFTSPRLIDEELEGIPLRRFLKENGVDYEVTSEIAASESLGGLLGLGRFLGLSFGAPWIFTGSFIARFKGSLLNLHSRDLPRNRGGGGPSWAIMNDDRAAANLLHMIAPGIDAGDIVKRRYFTFPAECQVPFDFFEHSAALDNEFLDEFLAEVKANQNFQRIPQNEEESVYFPRLHTPTHGFIDWDWATGDIVQFVRAFDSPYPGASTYWKGTRVTVRGAEASHEHTRFHPFMAGLVYRKIDGRIFVASSPDGVSFASVTDEHGADVAHQIRAGDRLVTPRNDLETAKSFHPVYTPDGLKKISEPSG